MVWLIVGCDQLFILLCVSLSDSLYVSKHLQYFCFINHCPCWRTDVGVSSSFLLLTDPRSLYSDWKLYSVYVLIECCIIVIVVLCFPFLWDSCNRRSSRARHVVPENQSLWRAMWTAGVWYICWLYTSYCCPANPALCGPQISENQPDPFISLTL